MTAISQVTGNAVRAPHSKSMLYQQLVEHATGTGASVIGNLINAIIVGFVFFASLPPTVMATGYAVLLCAISHRMITSKRVLAADRTDEAKLRGLDQQIQISAALFGLTWGVLVGGLSVVATPGEMMFLGIVGSGMMSAGTLTYRAVPKAARLFVGVTGICCLAGLLSVGTLPAYASSGLLACFVFVLLSSINRASTEFADRFHRDQELSESSETIRLLLNDYEEQGSDWLLEVSGDGLIKRPCARFAEAARRPLETLVDLPLMSLFADGPERKRLIEHFAAGRAFRAATISLTIDGQLLWWSISARPKGSQSEGYRGMITDITAQRQAEDKVSYMAHYDGLTNLPNRFRFNETLYRVLGRAKGGAGLMYLDLDNFKAINDTLGHPVGDLLLQGVARRLEDCVSTRETVARLGGDEFAILVPADRIGRIDAMAADIVEALGKPFSLGDHDVVIATSIGVACAPEDATTADHLLRNADLALYAAKSMGRNRAIRFEPGMDEAAQARRMVELDLRGALGKNEMRLHYQPLVNVETAETNGYEALIRWEHPERGIVMPATFIPIAEETGMIIQIGEWVIRQALSDLATWPEELTVSVNLSPLQMRSPTLISTLVHAIAANQVDASRICIEITESVLMQDSDANIETLHKLRELGIQIALDDFGTGYSSLNYLRSFPFSKIKIDRCFISDIDTREDCQAIVRSVVSLANSLGMSTTAEGVERAEQVAQLRLQGCGEVQGFLYSKAIPADQLTNLRAPKAEPLLNLMQFGDAQRERAKARLQGAGEKQVTRTKAG